MQSNERLSGMDGRWVERGDIKPVRWDVLCVSGTLGSGDASPAWKIELLVAGGVGAA
jgi:hypothetical protein